MKTISVCIATYNGERYIQEQLFSILKQLSLVDEIIISDDHSIDNTINLIKSINDSRIRIFQNDSERGYTGNFENAIRKSSGDIIFLSDQDDVWMDGKVEKMLVSLEKSDMVISDAVIVDSELKSVFNSHFELNQTRKGFLINFLKTRYIGACMAFHRKILDKALPFPKNHRLCAHDYWLTVIGEGYYKVVLESTPLIKYRRHSENASTGGGKSPNSIAKRVKVRFYVLYELIKRAF